MMEESDHKAPRRGDGVPKRLIVVMSVAIVLLCGVLRRLAMQCNTAQPYAGVPTLWSSVTTHRPPLRFDALDNLPNATGWQTSIRLVCHGSNALYSTLQHVQAHVQREHPAATVSLLHAPDTDKQAACNAYASQLSALADMHGTPADTVVVRVASSSECVQPTAATGTHATALILPLQDVTSVPIVENIVSQLLHGMQQLQGLTWLCNHQSPQGPGHHHTPCHVR